MCQDWNKSIGWMEILLRFIYLDALNTQECPLTSKRNPVNKKKRELLSVSIVVHIAIFSLIINGPHDHLNVCTAFVKRFQKIILIELFSAYLVRSASKYVRTHSVFGPPASPCPSS